MARLNDPPGATESVEVVKRRFLRQNRELAKCNSNQSIKIRSLESDISRLLIDNTALRERVIQLEAEIERFEYRPPAESVVATKTLLEAKILELGQLVAGLEILKKPFPKEKPQALATKKSPHERNWRNALLLSQAMGGEDLLPTIAEDKQFHKQTLSEQELHNLADHVNAESPELGPPPIAHFQDEGPIKFDTSRQREESVEDEDALVLDDIPTALSVNLETRRRRRSSHTAEEMRKISQPEPANDIQPSTEQLNKSNKSAPRIGSKRKFTVSDDESDRALESAKADDFRFNRRSSAASTPAPTSKRETTKAIGGRRALASKPTNLSPKKLTRVPSKDHKALAKNHNQAIEHARSAKGDENPQPIEPVAPAPTVEEVVLDKVEAELEQIELPPKTPAALSDFLSPGSTEASTAGPTGRDTPPPSDLNGDATDQQLAGRHSRRGRTAVSYAEPKLNVKMRRPGKELVDAVTKEAKPVVKIEGLDGEQQPLTVEKPKMRTVIIKRERSNEDTDWKELAPEGPEPVSPLVDKVNGTPQESAVSEEQQNARPQLSGASATISALMAGSLKTRRPRYSTLETTKPEAASHENDAGTQKRDDLAIFDFTESSPPAPEATKPLEKTRADSARARTARRHSTINNIAKNSTGSATTKCSTGDRTKEAKPERKDAPADTARADTTASRYERAASRRKSMML